MMKQWTYAALMITITILISGCTSVAEVESSVDEINQIPIKVESMRRDVVEHTYVAIGEIVPENQIDLFVTGGGYIEGIKVMIGDQVEVDDLVIQLDGSEPNRSNYNATESQLRTVRNDLKAQLDASLENQLIQESLLTEGIITKMEMDQINLQVSSLDRQYTNAAVAYRTQLAALNDSLDDSVKNRTIYSPVSGKVAAVYIKEGQAVNNQMAISIIDDSALYVKTYISSDLKKQLAIGDTVRVKLDGNEADTRIGNITQINELPDMTTKLFETMIYIENNDTYIIGDYAEVEFVIESYSAIMIPTQSIIRSGSNQYIYTLEDESLSKIEIQIGRTKETWVEVKGMSKAVEVVVRGQNQLTVDSQFIVVK